MTINYSRIDEEITVMVADLPFNAVLLAIGIEANAAYHIARRVYQQVMAPTRRGFTIAVNIFVGQSLGENADAAYINGAATTILSGVIASVLLFVGGAPIVRVFSDDPTMSMFATSFVQAFAIAGVFHAGFGGFRGALRGGSDTHTICCHVDWYVHVFVGNVLRWWGLPGVWCPRYFFRNRP